MSEDKLSAYRKAELEFRNRSDDFWHYLERNRHEDPTLCVGWAFQRAERFLGYDQTAVAERTAVVDRAGNVLVPAYSKSYMSKLLREPGATPEAYLRIARACEVNELEFFIAEGWTNPGSIASYQVPERELARPILERLIALPKEFQPNGIAVTVSVLDSMKAATERITAPIPEPEPARARSKRS